MKFTTTSVSFALVAGTLVSAASLPAICNQQNESVVGAAYFISNEPNNNNKVVVHEINSDGTLTFARGIWTGGSGSHGNDAPAATGPDALFSQGAVKVSGNNLFTINPGSNTAVMFAINEKDPSKLTMVGTPVSTGGEFPMAMAISSTSGNVCVANGGAVNGVLCFKADPAQGLVEIQNTLRSLNLPQKTPPTGPAGTVSHLLFSEDGTKLFASVKGVPPTPGFIAAWDVAKDGTLSPNFTKSTPSKGGLLPFSMTAVPGAKDAILNTDAGIGFSVYDFSKSDNATSSVIPINGQKATCWSSFSKKTGTFFLTDIGTSTVTEVKVDNNLKGSIVKQYPQAANSATIDNDVATIGNNDFLYVLAANATSIDVLSLNAPGQAKQVQSFNFGAAAKKAGVTVNPNNVQGMSVFIKSK